MQVDFDMTPDGNSLYYDPNFRYTLEAHIPYLLGLATTRSIVVDPHDAVVYNQDLFGYLLSAGILPCYHYVIMRLNGMFSPNEFNSDTQSLNIPSTTELESIRQSWSATTVIKT
jgi:hypothetical protein